jgi:hypothetical protein
MDDHHCRFMIRSDHAACRKAFAVVAFGSRTENFAEIANRQFDSEEDARSGLHSFKLTHGHGVALSIGFDKRGIVREAHILGTTGELPPHWEQLVNRMIVPIPPIKILRQAKIKREKLSPFMRLLVISVILFWIGILSPFLFLIVFAVTF